MSVKPQVLVIGLDGATFDLIKPWVEEGKLPTFERMLKAGCHGDLAVQLPYGTVPNWPSFSTGKNPGKHGFYSFLERQEGTYKIRPVHPDSRSQYSFWEVLSAHGYRVGVVNFPTIYPPRPVNGFIVTGMLTPNEEAAYTYPQEFKAEIKRILPDYRVDFREFYPNGLPDLLADLIQGLENRLSLTRYLMEEKQLDFVMVVIRGTDRIEHEYFRFVDPTHPLYDAQEVQRYGNPVLSYYVELDKRLGELLERIPQDTVVFFASDHGQQSGHKALNMGHFLLEHGYLKVKKTWRSRLKYWLLTHGWSPRSVVRAAEALRVKRTLKKARKRSGERGFSLQHALFFSIEDIDWAETKAYLPTESGGVINLNLKGREPLGQVEPGDEYEQIRRKLCDDLRELRDPETGARLIRDVYLREELYHGPFTAKAPDLVIVPASHYGAIGGHNFPFAELLSYSFGISGYHSDRGIFICLGHGIKKGMLVKDVNIVDLAPTILHVMGVPIPPDMDGQVLRQIFEDGSEYQRRMIQYADTAQADQTKRDSAGYSPDEEAAIEARLKALGYLD